MRRILLVSVVVAIAVIAIGGLLFFSNQSGKQQQSAPERVVINEAVRTLLYLPLYHAEKEGLFEAEGIDVEIVTAGTATASFAAMLSGEADFSQADPMYVPISREKGSDAVVVAQVVGRIAVWGFTLNPDITTFDASMITGETIATHPKPMTAYTYTVRALKDIGLDPERDANILQVRPGGELSALLAHEADIAFSLEPATSIAESQGAHVILSFPELLGDQVFTALMTREAVLQKRPKIVLGVMRAYQKSLDDLSEHPDAALATAKAYFPTVDEQVLRTAVDRLIAEKVFPNSIIIPESSWDRAVQERVSIGDLSAPYPYKDALALSVMQKAVAPQ